MERVETFGPSGATVGIYTAPETPVPGRPALLMSNVGLNHRVGPHRAWVELCRQGATLGYPSLRFDLCGLGDSPPRHETVDDIERAVLDFSDAVAHLKSLGHDRIVSVSLCSGTDNSHRGALLHEEVVGAVFIDGYTYRTRGFQMRKRLLEPLQKERWRRFLETRAPEIFGVPTDVVGVGAAEEIYRRAYPRREDLERELNTLVDRSVDLLFVYSGETDYIYPEQFFETFETRDWRGRVEVEYMPQADHTFRFLKDRQALQQRILRWLGEHYG